LKRRIVQVSVRLSFPAALAALYMAGVVLAGSMGALASSAHAQPPAQARGAARPVPETKPRWNELSPAQREVLKPLERDWSGIDTDRKQKWLAIAGKYPSMSPPERARVQERMAAWSRLSPEERGVARQQFQAAKRVAPQDRPAQWEAYQALTPQEKRRLAEQARPPAASPAPAARPAAVTARGDGRPVPPMAKSNIVPNPAFAPPPKPITSASVQAQPGATTTSMGKRAQPPAHQQPGLPKIAATPGFVDKTTLLPQRGPQGAAIRSTATEPVRQP
jgi:Protein of unknown function (DUF3106)